MNFGGIDFRFSADATDLSPLMLRDRLWVLLHTTVSNSVDNAVSLLRGKELEFIWSLSHF
jgi:hypothetical protein